MATNRKRTPRSRRDAGLNQAQMDWLHSLPYPDNPVEPWDYFCAYTNSGLPQYRTGPELWDRYKETILDDWIKENPCTRPERYWEFDAPGERLPGESQAAYLDRHGLLTKEEKTYLRKHPELLEPEAIILTD